MNATLRTPAVALFVAAGLSAAAAPHLQRRSMVLDNVRLIDGTGAPAIDRGRIVIEGDRLVRVGPAGAVPLPANAETLDLSGRTILPGLIDLHFHTEVPFAARGEAPWREMELLVESGFSPLEAIAAATSTAAAFLYRADAIGALRPGLQADLVILGADPSRDISAIRSVERVMVKGRWVDVARYRGY